jgi:diguanylate cyclase (GGDEF)-like protein
VGLRAKIVAITAAFVLTMLAAFSTIMVQQASTLVGEANRREVSAVSARMAMSIERASRGSEVPRGAEFAALVRSAAGAGRGDGEAPSVRLLDPEGGGKPLRLEQVGDWPEKGALVVEESLSVAEGGGPARKLLLRVAVPARGFREVLDAVYVRLLIALAVTLVLGAVLLTLLNGAYLRPIMELRRATQEVSRGELEVDIGVQTGDELEELADSFSGMLDRLAEMQEMALDANPLTGLPGNATIQRYVESAISSGLSRAVVYADLDNFKAYNDAYGFEAGDRAIAFTAELLGEVCAAHEPEAFVGHVGGDDFIFVTDPAKVDAAAGEIVRRFDERVPGFYSEEDRRRGYVVAKDRQHQEQRFGLMGISMASVDLAGRGFTHFSELAVAAAELKSQAKKQSGSVFLKDRRRG